MKKLALIALLVCLGVAGCSEPEKKPTGGSGSAAGSAK
jgi:hypothetical protein